MIFSTPGKHFTCSICVSLKDDNHGVVLLNSVALVRSTFLAGIQHAA